jgi:CRISPR system Cascade subunit CasB
LHRLGSGPQADLRRVARPTDLDEVPAFYRLFAGRDVNDALMRVAFCLPWVEHADAAPTLGSQFARARISEQRLFQVMRSTYPNDLIQFRRLLQQVEPVADWRRLGPLLLRWSREDKRRLLEEFYLSGKADETAA